MNIFSLVLLTNSVIVLILGGLVYFSRRKNLINKLCGILCLVLFIWSVCLFRAHSSPAAVDSLRWFRIANLAVLFLPFLFLHFILAFLEEAYKNRITILNYAVGAAVFVTALLFPNAFINKVIPLLSFRYYPQGGWLYRLYIAVFCAIVIYAFFRLLVKFIGAGDFKRNQARYLFIGWLFGISGVASFFPLTLGVPIYPVGNYFIVIFALIISYSIVKFHLMDIDIVINRMTLFAYSVGLTLFLHTGVVYLFYKKIGMDYGISSALSGGLILLMLLFLLHFQTKLKLRNTLDGIIYETRYGYRKAVEQLNETAMNSLDFDDLTNCIIMILVDNLGIEKASLLLIDRQTASYSVKAYYGLPEGIERSFSLPLTSELVSWLKKEYNIFSREDLKKNLPKEQLEIIAKDLKALEAKLSIPLFYGKELVGILNLGDKKDGKPLSQEEIDIINGITQQTTIHIKNALLYEDSITDSLTRLYNHGYLYLRIKDELDRAKRYMRPLALLMVDIDNFRNYNTRYGHHSGDRALAEIARILRSSIRKVDIIARYGGEEFCIIAPETPKRGAEHLAERLRKRVSEETPKPLEKGITVSIGVTAFERIDQNLDRQQFIKRADAALYKAKKLGGNKVVAV